jgi:hypothetical protein|tara:strand:+ start:652 stop:852 length:201 start_codon:yes stop_codon:yes gene_type:complete
LSIPVIEPDAVSLQEVTVAVAVAVASLELESSDLLQAPITAITPTIKTIQKSNFFILPPLLSLRKW